MIKPVRLHVDSTDCDQRFRERLRCLELARDPIVLSRLGPVFGPPRVFVSDHMETSTVTECALWSSIDPADESGGEYLDENYSIADIDPESLQEMKKDCAAFREKFKDLLAESGLADREAGVDIWLARTHHGAGYWDRGLGDVGRKLKKAAESCGDADLRVGADGRINLI